MPVCHCSDEQITDRLARTQKQSLLSKVELSTENGSCKTQRAHPVGRRTITCVYARTYEGVRFFVLGRPWEERRVLSQHRGLGLT